MTAERELAPRAGQTVIVYCNPKDQRAVVLKPGEVLGTRYGRYSHDEMIGAGYGSKIPSTDKPNGRVGWVYMLKFTPERWSGTLRHRTQIMYTPDMSTIIMRLGLRPGDLVLEAGTGSGAFTHYLARAVAPHGMVRTFDIDDERVKLACTEFRAHGVPPSLVSCECRDVCENGFGCDGIADAVFLDMPSPWLAVSFCRRAFRPSSIGRFCSFSPCFEQVEKTCRALEAQGFDNITTMELLNSPFAGVKDRMQSLGQGANDSSRERGECASLGLHQERSFDLVVSAPRDIPAHTAYLTFAQIDTCDTHAEGPTSL